jgi:hypothetical protein
MSNNPTERTDRLMTRVSLGDLDLGPYLLIGRGTKNLITGEMRRILEDTTEIVVTTR